jgi:hypothetical protein
MREADYSEARRFVDALYDYGTLTFQTASKTKNLIKPSYRSGTLDEHWEWLQEQNRLGANIYIMVNEGDGHGRRLRNVKSVASFLVDLDGAPLDPVLESDVKPHIITETSSGRFQGIWRIEPIPVTMDTRYEIDDLYKRVHEGLATKFNADPAVKSLSHVCRLPGFVNHNHEPFVVRLRNAFGSPILEIQRFIETLRIDLTASRERFQRLPDCEGIVVETTVTGEPIFEGMRNELLLRICFKLAYQDVLGNDLVRNALMINAARCRPPLEDDEVISLAEKVTRRYERFTDDLLVTKIRERNSGLRVHNGHFYRYDPQTRQHRMVELVALRNKIFLDSRGTANDRRIKEILNSLADQVPYCANLDNPEKRFIDECITVGGKAVLRALYVLYKSWCERKRIQPVSQSCLRKEIEKAYPGTFRKDVRMGQTRHRGFLGISAVPITDGHESIFQYP